MNRAFKIRFTLWLIVVLVFVSLFLRILFTDSGLNTNILDLLPKTTQDSSVHKASQLFTRQIGQKIIFLISNPNQALAEQSADNFYQTIAKSPLFSTINYKIDQLEQQSWASLYFPYRLSLLSPDDQKQLEKHNIQHIEQSALMALYSPIGISSSSLLEKDPYFNFQRFLTTLPKPAAVDLINSRPMIHANNRWYVLINAQLEGNSFSLENQNRVISLIEQAKTQALNTNKHTQVLMNGLIFYAKSGADSAQHEISTIGIGSVLGILLLVFLTFRSLSPLLLTLLSAATGFVAAFVVVKLYFSSIYLFTLVFGASLIGISVDYAFFYYADRLLGGDRWQASKGLKNIFIGISLGLLNVVIAYSILSITPFPGLKQLAVFAIVGLSMSYATVVCLFPLVLKACPLKHTPILLRLTDANLKLWQNIGQRKIKLIYSLLALVCLFGIVQLKTNDDIRQLQSLPQHLQHAEKEIKTLIGSKIGNRFYIIQADSPQKMLSKQHQLTSLLHKNFPEMATPYLSLSDYLPTAREQQKNYDLVTTQLIHHHLREYLKKIGMPPQQIQHTAQQLGAIKFKPLTLETWLDSPASKSLRFLWLGKVEQYYTGVVLLSDELPSNKLQLLAHQVPEVTFVDQATQVSHVFSVYRYHISILLALIYIVLLAFLVVRYGLYQGIQLYLPPLFACLVSLAMLGYLSIPLTLFNLLALILVLGISTDYVLFFAETYSSYRSTMLATFLSAVSTILSFGLLSLSSTAVIHDFGITVLFGITTAFILSPTVIKEHARSYSLRREPLV